MPSEISTELHYEERTVFRKRILNTGTWICELGIESVRNVPSWITLEFSESNKFDEDSRGNSVFGWLPVSVAVCRLGSVSYPDIYLNLIIQELIFLKVIMELRVFSPTL